MEHYQQEFNPPQRLLMGPGPSNAHPRVLQAMAAPLLGHLDPDFLQVMDDVQEMLRRVFQTGNGLCIPISGTGTAGMEAALVNVLEPGDTLVIGVNGFFGERLALIAARCGAQVARVEFEWGRPVEPEPLKQELRKHRNVKAVAVVHAETSTGVLTPLPELASVAHEHDALLIVDAVTSLGGVDLRIDEWDIDVCYSGTQKGLACPPGLAPITLSERGERVLKSRKHPVQSFYLDLTQLTKYWSQQGYHHTAPISMLYALREGLRLVLEEGLENRFRRHIHNAAALRAGLGGLGLTLFAQEQYRLPTLTTVCVPDGINDADVRRQLLQEFAIEIGGGLGPQAGRIWRIGLMGENARPDRVLYFLSALEQVLARLGYEVAVGAGVTAAQRVLARGE